ncbi:MAG: GTPase family protein [Desulfonatronovibrio sp.]|nr:GTPase domain-containing protein [Desulfovibrionales bacterium]
MTAVILPALVLVCFGVYALFKYGYILYFTGLLTLCAVLGASGLWIIRKKSGPALIENIDESLVQPSRDWSEFDLKVWEETNQHIEAILAKNSLWSDMGIHARTTAAFVAEKYHGRGSSKELSFSAIELLKMMEEVSRRYRLTLKKHVPYIEKVNISTLKMFYDHKDKVSKAGKLWNLYRTYRVFTPHGLLAEAKGMIISKMFSGVSQEMQLRLKLAFLQEVTSVAIDLYSGRFRFHEDLNTDAHEEDAENMAIEPDPLRICMVGQVSAGKSAIINALTGHIRAEVDRLPSTDKAAIYQCSIDGHDMMHLVDLPGLDGGEKNDQFIIKHIARSDMVLWVLKANQPSRDLDIKFYSKLKSFYMENVNRSKKKPVFIGILSHIDRLKPEHEWEPPYNLESPNSPKAQTIQAALNYNKSLLKMDEWVPVCVAEDKENFNVQRLGSAIAEGYDAALQTQLNRARLGSNAGPGFNEAFRRLKNSASALFN